MSITEDNYSIDQLAQAITKQNMYMQGIDYLMMCDVSRNQFYDKIISSCVKDKVVVDIGFGSGILTMMAIHHGAKKVYAFEQDAATFDFGKAMIQSMGYADKVEFFNLRWEKYNPVYDYDVIIHELLMRSFWGEGLKTIANDNIGRSSNIFPHLVRCEVWCKENVVDTNYYGQSKLPTLETGLDYLDMNAHFQKLLSSEEYFAFYPGWNKGEDFDKKIGEYTIDINKETVPDIFEIKVKVPPSCLVTTQTFVHDWPIIRHDGSWAPDKMVFSETGGMKTFHHRTSDGVWWLS